MGKSNWGDYTRGNIAWLKQNAEQMSKVFYWVALRSGEFILGGDTRKDLFDLLKENEEIYGELRTMTLVKLSEFTQWCPDHITMKEFVLQGPNTKVLVERVRQLETGLRNLLEDTQHKDHDCGDEDCPVLVAKELLDE